MTDFENVIHHAVTAQQVPGCAVMADNRDGSLKYAKAFGVTSMKPENAKPFDISTIMWIASCTKLMTSICAMQLVERGQITLDEPIYKHIPELKHLKVLTGFDETTGAPIEVEQTRTMTLRHLLSHASGLAYDAMHPLLVAWLQYHKKQSSTSTKLLERFSAPLVFQPGESWSYGSSLDYAGLLIERISGQSLEAYMKTNLWEPLGIKDMTFHLSTRPDLAARLADMSVRDESGKLHFFPGHVPDFGHDTNHHEPDCMGGQGVYTSTEEFFKVVRATLTTDTDEKILKNATVEEFFKPQLGEASRAMLNTVLQDDFASRALGGTAKTAKKDWGLGGVLYGEKVDERPFEAGTMIWGGYPNLIWFVDRKAGLAGLYASQIVPPGDVKSAELTLEFQKAMYKAHGNV
ncbi:hypothetical protein ACEQ8H_000457 [Pleosporales sp. CAS-2024a]